ncbi:MAG: ABC transporter permease [Acidimicrobiales bacterium]
MNRSLVLEVAAREIRTRSRTKAFRIITGILVVAAVVGPIVSALWPESDDELREITIGLVENDEVTKRQIEAFADGFFDVKFTPMASASEERLAESLSDDEVDVVIAEGPTLVWDRLADFEIAALLQASLQSLEVLERGQAMGLSDAEISELLTPLRITDQFTDKPKASRGLTTTVAFIGLMASFMLPQIYGQLTMMSVVEEKSTRVIEILLSHIRPKTLLLGKIAGIGALAIGQLVVVVGGLAAALLVTNAIEVPTSVWQFVPIILVSIVGGLAIYNTLFALLGSLISRQEDAAQVMLPVFIPLMAGYFAGQAAVFGNAESAIMKGLTLFPLTAPMLLPVRVAREAIAPWEVALSLALLALGVWAMIRIAGRVYEFTLLHSGSRVSWGELLRLSRGTVID